MSFFEKRIPTIIGLLILIIGVGAGIYLVGQKSFLKEKLDPESAPKKIKITNVTDSQFSVSWTTSKAAIGLVKYGTTSSPDSSLPDDRDQRSGEKTAFKTHYVTLSGLKPLTKYYFKIGSGSEKNLFDNNGKPYEITTGPALGAQPPSDLINGKAVAESGGPAAGAIVYATLPETAPLSAQVKVDGTWLIPLSSARIPDLSDYATYDPQTTLIDIFVQGEEKTAKATTNTANDSPVPEIALGKTYDFVEGTVVEKTEELAQATVPEATASSEENSEPEIEPWEEEEYYEDYEEEYYEEEEEIPSQFPLEPLANLPVEATPSAQVELLNPQTEGETINSLKPEFLGTGPARKVLRVKIYSEEIYASTVVVDSEGNWSFTPPEDLEPGTHRITITYVDDYGEEQTLERNFIIASSGDNDLPSFTATPSGEATTAASPSPTTSTPSARTSTPSTGSGVPSPGTVNPTILMLALGLLLTFFGFTLKLAAF